MALVKSLSGQYIDDSGRAVDPITGAAVSATPTTQPQNVFTTPSGAKVDSITGALLSPPPTTNFQTSTVESAVLPPALTLTPQESTISKGITDYTSEQEKIAAEKGAEQTRLLGESGISGLTKTQQDINNQLGMIKAEFEAAQREAGVIPSRIQEESVGRGRTAAGVAPLEAGELRKNLLRSSEIASRYSFKQAELAATQGNIATAQSLIDLALKQKYGAREEAQRVKLANLDLLLKDPSLTLAEKNRANAQKVIEEKRTADIAKQQADEKEIKNYAIEAAQRGANNVILSQIQSSKTPQEALQRASFYLGEDFRREIENKQFQRSLQEATFNLSFAKFNEDRRQFNLKYAQTQQEVAAKKLKELQKNNSVAAAEATAEVLQNKINLVDELSKHRGLNKAVGPSAFGRFTPFKIDTLSGDVQDFIAGVQQLVNKETIDTLVNLKARGGTLGALSDQERILLQSAATKIGTWQLKDSSGNVTGYNISEKAFKNELDMVKNLAIKAKARALGIGVIVEQAVTEEDELRAAGYSDEQIRLLKEIQ